MIQANQDIRQGIKVAGIRQWQVADAYGLNEQNFSRLLRKELASETKERIFTIIQALKNTELENAACR